MSFRNEVELWLVRHGESESNLKKVWQGHGDSPLSIHGRAQAAALGTRLRCIEFDKVVASPLSRAFDTALAISGDVHLESAFREIDVGKWEGLTRGEVAAKFPEEVAVLRAGSRDQKVGGGESWNDLSRRAGGALSELIASCETQSRVLLVCHGGVIATLVRDLFELGVNAQRMAPLRNTSLTRLRLTDSRVELLAFNDDAHLSRSSVRSPSLCTVLCDQASSGHVDERGSDNLRRSAEWLSATYAHREFPKAIATGREQTSVEALEVELGIPIRRELEQGVGLSLQHMSAHALCLIRAPEVRRIVSELLSVPLSRIAPQKVGAISELTRNDSPTLYSYGMLDF